MDKAGFDTKVFKFSQNYLVERKTLFVEQIFFFFQCWYWYWTELCLITYFISVISFFYFSYFWKKIKKPKNSSFFYIVIEHEKTEIFYFFKIHRIFNPPLLDLSTLGGSILHSKETWDYLRFIFNRKLTFQQHIKFYINKAISTVKCINLLRNSLRGLISLNSLVKNAFFLEHVSFPLLYIDFCYGFSTKILLYIHWRN